MKVLFFRKVIRPERGVVLVVLLLVLQSCYQYQIKVPTDLSLAGAEQADRTMKKPVVIHNYFWGAVRKPGYAILAIDCIKPSSESGKPPIILNLSNVNVKKTFGQSLITVLSLGICSPINLTWECGESIPQDGEINP